jgi:pyruvate,water dikinase
LTEQILKDIHELSGEECFSSTVKKGFSLLEPITEQAATYVPGQLALERIKRMFRGIDLEEDIAALGIALPSNPTTSMTRSLYALASNPEMNKAADVDEFVRRIKTRDFDNSFLLKIDEYLAKYGGRGFYEIDVASERVGDDYTLLFRQMGDISVDDNALQRAEDKKKLAIEKLSQIAVSKGKGEAFRKNLERYEKLFGLRETPKYVSSMLLGRLHRLALVMGRRWVAEGRLDEENQVFDLRLEQIKRAEREAGLALRPMMQINMEPYLRMKNVKHWPITFDSRGRTINPVPEIAEGGMKGQSISLGVVRGRAKVLIDPYEKPLLSGEILVTHAIEPSWMVILLNATGVVLEVGGNLQHGAIIAREFGIPCVSGLRRATTLIHDGDLVEVDGNNGLVRILEKSEIEND